MPSLAALAESLRTSRGIAAKADIAGVVQRLGLIGGGNLAASARTVVGNGSAASLVGGESAVSPVAGGSPTIRVADDAAAIRVGDDCAAIPDGDGYLLLAIEGFINAFVAADPWFAGWCGVMVNVSDIVAMGGRPIAVVDALWSTGAAEADPMLAGLRAAAAAFNVPLVGGHTNQRSDRPQLSVAILGRATRLLTSFDAHAGDRLIAAFDLRGRYREPFPNWEAATDAPAARLRGDMEILPAIAEAGLCVAAKDISQGGVIGTAMMLAECSSVGLDIDLSAIPCPENIPLERWLQSFPSFGHLLSVAPNNVAAVLARFAARDIAAADIASVTGDHAIRVNLGSDTETIWNFATSPLIGCVHA